MLIDFIDFHETVTATIRANEQSKIELLLLSGIFLKWNFEMSHYSFMLSSSLGEA